MLSGKKGSRGIAPLLCYFLVFFSFFAVVAFFVAGFFVVAAFFTAQAI
jgi:hypothetical protein